MILETLTPYFKQHMSDTVRKKMREVIIRYIDKNSSVLYTLDLSTRISFSDFDRNSLYELFGLNEDIIKSAVKASKIHQSNKIQSNPFYCFCEVLIHFLKKEKDKLSEEDGRLIASYMSLMMYVSVHFGFAKYGANPEIMHYTINNLDNNFKIRKMSSLYEFLKDNSDTWYNTYEDLLTRCDDKDIALLNDALHTRIKAKMKKIFAVYYDNHKHGRYFNYESDSFDDDDYHIMDNDTYVIDRLTTRCYVKLINKQFDKRLIQYSVDSSDVSLDKLTKILDDIIVNTADKRVKEYISDAINYYARTFGMDTLTRGEFISNMRRSYGSNTKAELMVRMKEILEEWINENMYKYGRATYGNTVKNQYKKSLYMFFVLFINIEAKS